MALRKRVNKIEINQVKAGQVLEIDYIDSGRVMIMVIDPKVTVKNNVQSRPGNLFAFKLKSLTEKDASDLIIMARNALYSGENIYDKIKTSKYVDGGEKSLRSYKPEKIKGMWRVTLGHPVDVKTRKLEIGNSVLYGVKHGSYVYVHENDWDELESELRSKKATFYEGTEGHEKPVKELIQYLIGKTAYTSDSWENPDAEEAPVLNLFGGETDTIIDQIRSIMRGKKYSGRVVDILASTSGRHPNNKASWGANKLTADEIIKISKLAPSLDTTLLEKMVTSREEFENVFIPFHKAAAEYAFGKDFRREKPEESWFGKFVPKTELETITKKANLMRDVYLVKMMRERPGVYFAGEGHIDLVRLVLRAQKMGVNV